MRITIGELRRMIRASLREAAGGITVPRQPTTSNPMAPSMPDRERIGKNSIRQMDPDDVSPHLREPVYDEEDCWGPVPPTGANPYAMPDPYAKDYHVIPTPQIKR